jgi:hypothetical protein
MEEEDELVERKKHGGWQLRGLGNIVLGLGLGFVSHTITQKPITWRHMDQSLEDKRGEHPALR